VRDAEGFDLIVAERLLVLGRVHVGARGDGEVLVDHRAFEQLDIAVTERKTDAGSVGGIDGVRLVEALLNPLAHGSWVGKGIVTVVIGATDHVHTEDVDRLGLRRGSRVEESGERHGGDCR
jgi:hypothetical protein